MKSTFVLGLILMANFSFASQFLITKAGSELKVAEVEGKISCQELYDSDPETDVKYICKKTQFLSEMSSQLGTVVKTEGLDSISRDTLSNLVDNSGQFKVRYRVYYY